MLGDLLSEEESDIYGQQKPFLAGVFEKLKKMRGTAKYPTIQVGKQIKGYKTIPIQKLQSKGKHFVDKLNGKAIWEDNEVKELYCYEESCHLTKESHNGLFSAFFEAYINHGDVMITPDDIWTAIMLYFSEYLNSHAEQLRKAFVSHEGKKELVIETKIEKSQYQWNEFFDKVIIAIKENTVKGVTEKFQCNFTSTDRFFTIFSTAIIMNSFKKYFDYTRMIAGCGIQNIHMGGTLQDWEKVAERLQSLKKYDVNGQLKRYIQRLTPIIDEFIETYKGKANLQFWNNIYHERKFPNASFYEPSSVVNGWLLRFFTLDDTIYDTAQLKMQQISVPIKVINELKGTIKQLNLIGGCRGISVRNQVYRPHYSFAIVEKKEQKVKRIR